MKRTAYLFSGLGSDERVFKFIDFGADTDVVVIKWETPLKNESVSDYAKRLCAQIKEANSYYVGVSFGGLIATEVNKHIPAKKIILVSSIKGSDELPGMFGIAGKLGMYKMANVNLIKRDAKWIYNMYGVKEKKHQQLLHEILKDLDPVFFKWAVKQLMVWNHKSDSNGIVHLHGTKDNAFPYKRIKKPDYSFEGAGHFMVFDKAPEISQILQKEIV